MTSRHLQLISALREDSRRKLTEISKQTNIPISTLFDVLKEVQGSLVTKNTVLLNFFNLGYHAHAQVFLKVDQITKEELRKHLTLNPCVNSLYKTNNGWDFMIETVHKNIRELDDFLEKLNQRFPIKEQQIHYLIDEIKKEGFQVS
ncbi:MAG: Lrp/AsnC family transcriptional regulator [Candidatus Woesearchaeota archaeon]|jgi:DNA-binding Lrp family transcriptional regulator